MKDPERIWLQNADDARVTGDRLWCQDKVWPECAEQQEPTEYIRADLCASRISQQDAELERLRREVEATQKYAGEKSNQVAALIRELNEARKAAFIEAAEIAETLGVYPELNVFAGGPEWYKRGKAIAKVIRAKAEGQP